MGYSARYHAASLAAVFLALAVGILIGAGLGDNVLSDTEENLRESLQNDIEEARGDADEMAEQLDRERAFASRAYPALVSETLRNRAIGVVALGELPPEVAANVEDALDPTGAELAEVVVVRQPPDAAALADELGQPFAQADEDNGQLEELGARIGGQLVRGRGKQLDAVRDVVFARASGEGGPLDGVVIVRGSKEPDDDEGRTKAFNAGLIEGLADTEVATVAVERSDVAESAIPFFAPFDVATVDSVDLTSGRAALVFTLLGAEGSFGIKGTANALLPELLERPRRGEPSP
ncbi:MAG TPA: copper transporter [Solirubrobacterales bacterium]|nr:copper transporter [Solirubrobacterales bacterium]